MGIKIVDGLAFVPKVPVWKEGYKDYIKEVDNLTSSIKDEVITSDNSEIDTSYDKIKNEEDALKMLIALKMGRR